MLVRGDIVAASPEEQNDRDERVAARTTIRRIDPTTRQENVALVVTVSEVVAVFTPQPVAAASASLVLDSAAFGYDVVSARS
ncbi:MAG TPA: hypothetical protein VFG69_15745 [Nannocystaceae bacterium]|nr:hypothetical protein [Nannocystaceae bacterium]